MEDRYRQRIIARLDKQREKGVAKYGGTLESNRAGMVERLEHLAQELTDGLEYVEWIKELIKVDIGHAHAEGMPQHVQYQCHYGVRACRNERCFTDAAYRRECRNNYFYHHQTEEENLQCTTNSAKIVQRRLQPGR